MPFLFFTLCCPLHSVSGYFSCLKCWSQQHGQILAGSGAFHTAWLRRGTACLAFPPPWLWWGIFVHEPLTLLMLLAGKIAQASLSWNNIVTKTLVWGPDLAVGLPEMAASTGLSWFPLCGNITRGGSKFIAACSKCCYVCSAVVCFFTAIFITSYKA